jgi:hypothetical protein
MASQNPTANLHIALRAMATVHIGRFHNMFLFYYVPCRKERNEIVRSGRSGSPYHSVSAEKITELFI